MTGLDLKSDRLIEIAVLVTDAELNILGDGIDVVIHAPTKRWPGCPTSSSTCTPVPALSEEVRGSTTDARSGRGTGAGLHPHRRQAGQDGSAGRQLHRHRPRLHRPGHADAGRHLRYRMVDVSTIKELSRRWYPRIYFGQPAKGMAHRALADIHESIRAQPYYRQDGVGSPPGLHERYRRDLGRVEPAACRRRPNGFGCRASERLVSTAPQCLSWARRRWWL